ncbi:hypothetical protein V496_09484 [Pseudogymnoascus sp. VKM F-4515 (FW-2607)]|nr:hypothetical protein V496_09484 [Pseudogymnoascus sp. VKM F-4515 (FW-2607)]
MSRNCAACYNGVRPGLSSSLWVNTTTTHECRGFRIAFFILLWHRRRLLRTRRVLKATGMGFEEASGPRSGRHGCGGMGAVVMMYVTGAASSG